MLITTGAWSCSGVLQGRVYIGLVGAVSRQKGTRQKGTRQKGTRQKGTRQKGTHARVPF